MTESYPYPTEEILRTQKQLRELAKISDPEEAADFLRTADSDDETVALMAREDTAVMVIPRSNGHLPIDLVQIL